MNWWLALVFGVILLFGFVVARGAPYVPSHRRFVRLAFDELYPLSDKDMLVDLGSGDGIVLRQAARKGARAIGYELNPALVVISRILSRGNADIQTRLADYWLVELPDDMTVVYVFAVSRDIVKLEKKMQLAANERARSFWLITYGTQLKGRQPVKTLHAHSLYLFKPTDAATLQDDEA